jgi:hypothetical protein
MFMKNYYVMLVCFFLACSAKKEMYQVECFSLTNDGYVELKVSNLINPTEYQIEQASIDAIKAILFTGYSSTKCQTQTPLLNSIEAKDNFKRIQSSFFSKKGPWKNFVRNSSGKNIENGVLIMISKEQLRKYLEDTKIIKKLTNGF